MDRPQIGEGRSPAPIPGERRALGQGLVRAVEVMAQLRGEDGCPWDREQTHASLVRYAVEEAHEVADAVAREAWDELPGELGDLLLQVLFHAQIAAEEGRFDVDDVAASLVEKLTRRHPHVFGGERLATAAEVAARWEEIKEAERPAAFPLAEKLARLPAGLPALARAHAALTALSRLGGDPQEAIREASRATGGMAAVLGDAVGKAWLEGAELELEALRWVAALEEVATGGRAVPPTREGEIPHRLNTTRTTT